MQHRVTLLPQLLRASFVCLLASQSMPALADGDAAAGEQKAAICAACHGPGGNSLNPLWPKLAAQHADYIVDQLQAFQSGARSDPLMSSQATALSEQDMLDLAAYYSMQTLSVGSVPDDADLVALGERLYRGGNTTTGISACIACHGPNGRGNPAAGFAAIGGQHSSYVAKALREYAAGTRQTDPESMMRDVAGLLTTSEIEAIAAYVQGLH